jgi:hypothetical protein
MNHAKKNIKKIMMTSIVVLVMCSVLTACEREESTVETVKVSPMVEWENDPTIGKVQPGYYKRVGITKDGETYEEMLKLRDIENQGYLIVNDDGTAYFELDGEKTEYTYDKLNFYLSEDTQKDNPISYTFIGGRIVADEGDMIIQYLKLTDEELEEYIKNSRE